jgi:predicted phosphodiesterase
VKTWGGAGTFAIGKNCPYNFRMSDENLKIEMLNQLRDLASELRRAPTQNEYMKATGHTRHQILSKFGGLSQMLACIGLSANQNQYQKIDNSIFQVRDLEKHLSDQPRTPQRKASEKVKIASISDIHWPFHSQRVVDKFLAFIEKHQPDYIFINGDAWDMYSHGKFPRSLNVISPREERDLSRKHNEEFWKEVKKRCPNAKCVQMLGNHEARPMKRIIEEYPEAEDWLKKAIQDEFTFEGVETIFDPRQEYFIGNIAIFHGYRSKLGDHRDYTGFNCIVGHTHRGGTVFKNIRNEVLWELNSGLAGDPLQKGLTYTPQKINEWTQGFAWVDEHGPRFISA